MKNEKNFFIAIALTILVLYLYPTIIKQFFPNALPIQKARTVIRSTPADTNENTEFFSTINQQKSYLKEKSYILENFNYTVVLNAPYGDIKSIELKKFIDPATGKPSILMDTENKYNGIFATQGILEKPEIEDVFVVNNKITFVYKPQNDLKLTKTIIIDDETLSLTLSMNIENLSEQEKSISYRIIAATGINAERNISSRYMKAITKTTERKKIHKKSLSGLRKEFIINGEVEMTAFQSRYFSLVLVPVSVCDYSYANKNSQFIRLGLGKNNLTIPANTSLNQNYILYAGSNSLKDMSDLNLNIEVIKGSGFFTAFSDFLLNLLHFLQKIFKNYGIAVIALALIINLFLYPLTFKSLKSMKEMQALQPHIEELRNLHKDNPQKLNKETILLYKKHKVNPVGGCLPIFLQMPVFFALYKVLMTTIELRGANFLWIKDLSSPDALFVFQNKLPFIGNSFNFLPIVMVIVSFIQQKKTVASQANEQQKTMALIMPIFMGVIFYNFPSGLVLYFLTNTIFSIAAQSILSVKSEK
ncbi:MAG: hypothetical protein DRP78_01670 [Candidatus Omnitrophota bacterium]|nr:MAG: hypothetical protein DRP78_01670 [Candidatus Omnitrophota bacterium]